MASNRDLLRRREVAAASGIARFPAPLTVASARGAIITDVEGREFIDLSSGIGVTSIGHCDPGVVEAIREQAGKLLHICSHVGTYEPYVALCERLNALFPHGKPGGEGTRTFLCNTGAEAVENAVKIARQATGRAGVICYTEAFHGRTLMAMTLTSKVGYKTGCGPMAPEVYRLPFPNRFKYGNGMDERTFVERELGRLRMAFATTIAPSEVAAIIIEPVQGEGGFVPAPFAYLRGLRQVCDEHGIVLICDEVQTGFCRTGKWGAYQHAGITPDISTWAKALGGGLPIAAVVGRAGVMDRAAVGTLGGTYGGNPVSCAAALATIKALERNGCNERAERIGRAIMERFRAIKERCALVADVRGLGAMAALEFCDGGDPSRPRADVVKEIILGCFERGVLAISAGVYGNCIRVLAPLVITDEQLERALGVLEEETVRRAGSA